MFMATAGLGGVLIAAGCVPAPPPPPTVPVAAPALPPAPPALADAAVEDALAAAERALAADRLLTPPDDCAHLHFSRALALAPNLPEARRGMERIVERYLALAHRAIDRENWRAAGTMLDRAAVVDAAHPGIEPVRRHLRLQANAERVTLDLDRNAVRAQSPALAARLAAFGRRARNANARVTIRAASDAQGRWIHAQLRKAPGTVPVRGNIELGLPPKVTIVVFDPAGADGVEG